MGIKRFYANKDNTISNALKSDLINSGSKSNMGASDILEVFSIFAQASTSSLEESRVLISFPIEEISASIARGEIPTAAGSGRSDVKYFIKLFNAEHSNSTPEKFFLDLRPVNTDHWGANVDPEHTEGWTEGQGLDMENYSDSGSSNWISARSDQDWGSPGCNGITDTHANLARPIYFERGDEDISIDMSAYIKLWLANITGSASRRKYDGLLIRLSGAYASGSARSYYTKKFFARGSQFFFKRPCIEAVWDSSKKDDRGTFFASSSLLSSEDNLHKLFLYNNFRGQPKNIPLGNGSNDIYVEVYPDVDGKPSGQRLTTLPSTPITGGIFSDGRKDIKGIYTASLALNTTSSVVHDVWFSGSTQFFTGTFNVKQLKGSDYSGADDKYVTSIRNLRPTYKFNDKPRIRLFTRKKDWCPTVYTVASKKAEVEIVEDVFYKVTRISDNLEVIPYMTGSNKNFATRVSYDASGSYFDLDMSLLEPDYAYELRFTFYLNGHYQEQRDKFKFRVEEDRQNRIGEDMIGEPT